MRDIRHADKFLFTLISSKFYEPFHVLYNPTKEFLQIARQIFNSKKWSIRRDSIWLYITPDNYQLPLQGWKIHVSATLENAARLLKQVCKIMYREKCAFKFLLDKKVLSITNYKNWSRGSSGKFITIYPSDEEKFRYLLEELFKHLKEEKGPYILSDRRYKESKVLYYRYGGITPLRRIAITGEKEEVLLSSSGEEVPDSRTPYFNLPNWVKDPFPWEENRGDSIALKDNRYFIKKALFFSNSGGVYLAEDKVEKREVVIKEARPYTCFEDTGIDAIQMRQREYEILGILKDTGVVPKPLDIFIEWEHLFIVMEYIKGFNLREIIFEYSPLLRTKPKIEDTLKFYEIFRKIFLNLAKALQLAHNRNIVLGDLSPNNVIVIPENDYSIKLIDFEGAFKYGKEQTTYLHTPGFRDIIRVMKKMQNYSDDIYTLGKLMFYSIFPLNALEKLRKDLYTNVLEIMLKDLGWPEKIHYVIEECLGRKKDCSFISKSLNLCKKSEFEKPKFHKYALDKGELTTIVKKLGEFILENINYGRDRLFPADPFMYLTNPLSLGFGAIGVMYVLNKCGFEIPEKAFLWVEHKLREVDEKTYCPSLLTGISGIAWGLWELGYEEKALNLMKIANNHKLVKKHHSLYYGSAGVGLANLYFYFKTSKTEFLEIADEIGSFLLSTANRNKKGIYWKDDKSVWLGYGYGQSGVALFLLRLYQFTGKKKYLQQGEEAIKFDLSYGKKIEENVMSFPSSSDKKDITLEHYVEIGTAGIVKVILRYRKKVKTELINDIHRKYSIFCGLIFGLSSFIDTLIDAYIFLRKTKYLRMIERPLAGVKELYLLKTKEGLATPGDNLFRISCDYATGVAGVMRAIHRIIMHDKADFVLDEIEK